MPQEVPPPDRFADRHIGPRADEIRDMLALLGFDDLDALADAVVPGDIRLRRPLDLPGAVTEAGVLAELSEMAARNQVWRRLMSSGYSGRVATEKRSSRQRCLRSSSTKPSRVTTGFLP